MLKLVLELEHLQCFVLELLLLVLFQASLIQLELVEHFYKSKSLIPLWQA